MRSAKFIPNKLKSKKISSMPAPPECVTAVTLLSRAPAILSLSSSSQHETRVTIKRKDPSQLSSQQTPAAAKEIGVLPPAKHSLSSPSVQVIARDNHRNSRNCLHKCEYCHRAFPFKVALQLHIKDHILQNSYKCPMCSASYHSKYQLSMHLRKHSGDRPYKCEDCNVTFINASNLQRHIRNTICQKRADVKPKVVSSPLADFNDKVVIREGTLNVSAGNSESASDLDTSKYCKECNETFATMEDYSHHEDLHKTGNIFTCKNCSKNFCTLPRLSGETLGEDERYWRNKCMLCGATCHSDADLFVHLRKHLDNNEDLYCKECQKSKHDTVEDLEEACSGVDSSTVLYNNSAAGPALLHTNDVQAAMSSTAESVATLYSFPCSVANASSSQVLPATIDNNSVNGAHIQSGPFSQVTPFPGTYFAANVTNVNNFVGTFYQQNINGQQRFFQSVCNIIPTLPVFSSSGLALASETGELLNTLVDGSVIAATPNIVMMNSIKPGEAQLALQQSYPCAQVLPSMQLQQSSQSSWSVPCTTTATQHHHHQQQLVSSSEQPVNSSSCSVMADMANTTTFLPSVTPALITSFHGQDATTVELDHNIPILHPTN